MKKFLIPEIPNTLPDLFKKYTQNSKIYDSSCSPEARVYFIEGAGRDSLFYLKCAKAGTLLSEAQMTRYFHSISLGAEVVEYTTEREYDFLLTRAVSGEDCTHAEYLSDPKRLARTTGTLLRALHEISPAACPVTDRVSEYIDLAETNYSTDNFDKSHFPDSFGYRSANEAYAVLEEGKHLLRSDTLIHGDYCLPNVMLENWQLSAFIDLDHAGIGDRHIDLFWGAWTLGFNLGTDAYANIFFDAYGRDKIDPDALRVVAAAEVFG